MVGRKDDRYFVYLFKNTTIVILKNLPVASLFRISLSVSIFCNIHRVYPFFYIHLYFRNLPV